MTEPPTAVFAPACIEPSDIRPRCSRTSSHSTRSQVQITNSCYGFATCSARGKARTKLNTRVVAARLGLEKSNFCALIEGLGGRYGLRCITSLMTEFCRKQSLWVTRIASSSFARNEGFSPALRPAMFGKYESGVGCGYSASVQRSGGRFLAWQISRPRPLRTNLFCSHKTNMMR